MKLIIILLIGLVFESIGVVCLKRGLEQVGEVQRISVPEILRVVRGGLANGNIYLGTFFELLFFIALLILMSKGDVSFIWPLTSLGFVITPIAAHFYLREQVGLLRWAGIVLIMMGAATITWSEHVKPKTAPAAKQSELRVKS
jgi:uncharacterized membrane protein